MQSRPHARPAPTVDSEVKNISDFSDINAFDRNIWLGLYQDIDKPAAAQAILEMSEKLPILVKLYPALIVRARQTLIHQEQEQVRRLTRRTAALQIAGDLSQMIRRLFKAAAPATQLPKKAPIFLKQPR